MPRKANAAALAVRVARRLHIPVTSVRHAYGTGEASIAKLQRTLAAKSPERSYALVRHWSEVHRVMKRAKSKSPSTARSFLAISGGTERRITERGHERRIRPFDGYRLEMRYVKPGDVSQSLLRRYAWVRRKNKRTGKWEVVHNVPISRGPNAGKYRLVWDRYEQRYTTATDFSRWYRDYLAHDTAHLVFGKRWGQMKKLHPYFTAKDRAKILKRKGRRPKWQEILRAVKRWIRTDKWREIKAYRKRLGGS